MASGFSLRDGSRPAMEGVFTMRVLDTSGTVLWTFSEKNMIVNNARTALSMLVSEGADTGKVITKFGVGIGNETATPADTGLTGAYINTITGHTFPEPGTVKFSWRLNYDEANGLNICEFGLFCEDDSLFSRKVREPIFKGSDLAFEGEWSIIF